MKSPSASWPNTSKNAARSHQRNKAFLPNPLAGMAEKPAEARQRNSRYIEAKIWVTPSENMLLTNTENGLFCEAGNFYVDPWRPVEAAVITHAHSDHARAGSRLYLTEASGKSILQQRLGPDARIETLCYGENHSRNGVNISLHPAGHILGSAQVRIE